jgi:hypothetical protein
MTEVSLFDRVFANAIAFLLPGMVVLAGASAGNEAIRGWFGAASTDPSLVGFLFIALAALTIGYLLTSIRWWVFEAMKWPVVGRLVPAPTPINEEKRKEHHAAYEDLRFQHYYHYLASGNMAVALPIAFVLWFRVRAENYSWQALLTALIVAVFVTRILGRAACEAVRRYDSRRARLLGGPALTTNH